MRFFVGLHKPWHAVHFPAAFISVNVLRTRRKPFGATDWILDSGAFTEVTTHGGFRQPVEDYAREVRRLSGFGTLLAAVAQDFMCEGPALARTGLDIPTHQRLTVERFDALRACDTANVYVMPVLQGFAPRDYLAHLEAYGARLAPGAWVGVGSICKRNGRPGEIEAVLLGIRARRPDLRLHGFGIKKTALGSALVSSLLATADSMAWSHHARHQGRNPNDWREAERYVGELDEQPVDLPLFATR